MIPPRYPLHFPSFGGVFDSDGSVVITCSRDSVCGLYSDLSDPGGMCDKCGRIMLRMIEATPEQCGLEEKK